MTENRLYLQIVTAEGDKIRFPAGAEAEADLIDLCVKEIVPMGVGMFRTEAQVEAKIREGIKYAIYKFKLRTIKG